jgi:hypothetical protein
VWLYRAAASRAGSGIFSKKLQDSTAEARIAFLKRCLECGCIRSFEDIFLLFHPHALGRLVQLSARALTDKAARPEQFTYNEITRLADALQVGEELMHRFIRKQLDDVAAGLALLR